MASTKPKRSKLDTGELGYSGTVINYGIISGEEYNLDLMGRRKFAAYNEMRLGNSSVSTSLEAVKLPIVSAKYTVQAASDSAQDVEIADKLEYNLFQHIDWKQFLRESLTYLDMGFSTCEQVYEFGEIGGTPLIILDRLAFRKQSSVWTWETKEHEHGLTQITAMGQQASIPMDKLFLLSHKREGDNYEGHSLLRTAYANWFYLKTYYKIDAIGYERQALGVVDIEYPTGSSPETRKELENAARNIRANEQSYFSHPVGYTMQWMDMKAGTLKDPSKAIDHHVREIAKNVQAQFNEIGARSSSGAYSSSQTQYELFLMAVQSVAETLIENFNRQVVKPWVDMNYNVTAYPKVLVPKIGDENMEAMVKSIVSLVTAGIITPTDEDEKFFRDKFTMPDLPAGLEGQPRAKAPSTAAPADTPPVVPDAKATDKNKDVKASTLIAAAKALRHKLSKLLHGSSAAS